MGQFVSSSSGTSDSTHRSSRQSFLLKSPEVAKPSPILARKAGVIEEWSNLQRTRALSQPEAVLTPPTSGPIPVGGSNPLSVSPIAVGTSGATSGPPMAVSTPGPPTGPPTGDEKTQDRSKVKKEINEKFISARCVCMCLHMCARVHACMHVHVCMRPCMHVHVCMFACVHACACVREVNS